MLLRLPEFITSNPYQVVVGFINPIHVVVPIKFDKRVGVNVAGIHYRIHSIGIESHHVINFF